MARPRGFEPDEALHSAMTMFWERGFLNTSVAELVAGTGVNRHSLYETFGDKQAIYRASLERFSSLYFERMVADLRGEAGEPGGLAAIERFLRRLARRLEDPRARHGCMILNSATLRDQLDEATVAFVDARLRDLFTCVKDAVRAGQQAGEIRADLDAAEATRFIAVIAEGMTLMRGVTDDSRFAEQSIGLTLDALRRT